jgi:hypothetical protein
VGWDSRRNKKAAHSLWSKEKIDAGRAYDRRAKERYYATGEMPELPPEQPRKKPGRKKKGLGQKIKEWWEK